MEVAALVVWIITAAGGFVLLGTWIAKGGHRPGVGSPSRFPPGLVFGHFLLAAVGLVLWIIYVATDSDSLTWVAFGVVLVAALGGFVLLSRWLAPGPRPDRLRDGGHDTDRRGAVPGAGGGPPRPPGGYDPGAGAPRGAQRIAAAPAGPGWVR